jgi:hypothetical protein
MYVSTGSTAKRAQLRKPGAPGVLFLQAKYDPASRMKRNAKLIIDDIQYSRKSGHDKYEFRTVSFTFVVGNYILSPKTITRKQTQQTDSSTTPP